MSLPPARGTHRLGLLAFAGSGAASLALQTVWVRALSRPFGSSSLALATVVGVWMAGLALGALWAARRPTPRPLRAWMACEVVVAGWGLGFLPALHLAEPGLAHIGVALETSPWTLAAVRALLAATALGIPTLAMGASLPWLARAMEPHGVPTSRLYAANTAGALLGALATGLVLLPLLGMTASCAVASAVAGLVAVVARRLDRAWPTPTAVAPPVGRTPRWPLVALFVSGVTAMAAEVLAARTYGLVLGSATESITLVIVALLAGTAAGARWLGPRLPSREADRRSTLGLLLAASAATVYVLAAAVPSLPDLWFTLRSAMPGAPDDASGLVLRLALTAPLWPSAALWGATWTVALDGATPKGPDGEVLPTDAAHAASRASAANTVGAVLGSVLGGFVLLPGLGLQDGWRVLAAALALTGAALNNRARDRALAVLLLVPIGLAPAWDLRPLTLGLYRQTTPDRRAATLAGEIVFHADGVASTVTVARHQRGRVENLTLYNNGKPDATSVLDADTQTLLGLLPPMWHGGENLDVLVIGYGSGMTVGALAAHPAVRHVEVVELEGEVYRAADALFGQVNGRPEADAKVTRRIGDGRLALFASDRRWDIIVSEPPNPWVAGVADLFTADFYRLALDHLKPDGLLAQWVQIYELRPSTLRTIYRTFASTLPNATGWRTSSSDTMLMGGPAARDLDLEAVAHLGDPPSLRPWLARARAVNGWDLAARYAMGPDALLAVAGAGPTLTDDDAWLDHAAHRDLLGALDDPTASAWLHEISTDIGDRGKLHDIVPGLPPGPARGEVAAELARALARARRWDQARAWLDIAHAEGVDTADLDESFRQRGKVFIRPN